MKDITIIIPTYNRPEMEELYKDFISIGLGYGVIIKFGLFV